LKLTIKPSGPVTVYPAPDGAENADGTGEYWQGWPAKIPNSLAFRLMNEIFKADGLVRWSLKNRWLLNRKKPGPRVLGLDYNQEVKFKAGQTITHYFARCCVRCVQSGKKAAEAGNADKASMYWAKAETAAERLFSSWLQTLAAKEARRVRGVKRYGEDAGSETRERVKRALRLLPEPEGRARGVVGLIAERLGISETQARVHIRALGYGATNKKRGA
jgi:hypothetical protein